VDFTLLASVPVFSDVDKQCSVVSSKQLSNSLFPFPLAIVLLILFSLENHVAIHILNNNLNKFTEFQTILIKLKVRHL